MSSNNAPFLSPGTADAVSGLVSLADRKPTAAELRSVATGLSRKIEEEKKKKEDSEMNELLGGYDSQEDGIWGEDGGNDDADIGYPAGNRTVASSSTFSPQQNRPSMGGKSAAGNSGGARFAPSGGSSFTGGNAGAGGGGGVVGSVASIEEAVKLRQLLKEAETRYRLSQVMHTSVLAEKVELEEHLKASNARFDPLRQLSDELARLVDEKKRALEGLAELSIKDLKEKRSKFSRSVREAGAHCRRLIALLAPFEFSRVLLPDNETPAAAAAASPAVASSANSAAAAAAAGTATPAKTIASPSSRLPTASTGGAGATVASPVNVSSAPSAAAAGSGTPATSSSSVSAAAAARLVTPAAASVASPTPAPRYSEVRSHGGPLKHVAEALSRVVNKEVADIAQVETKIDARVLALERWALLQNIAVYFMAFVVLLVAIYLGYWGITQSKAFF